jgi:molecular chaperone GrpE
VPAGTLGIGTGVHYAARMPDPETDEFDAVAAAKELDDLLAEPSLPAADAAETEEYIHNLEAEIEELKTAAVKRAAELAAANQRANQAYADIEAAEKRLATASAKELEQRTRRVLETFLPVIDDMDRGIAAAKKHVDSADVVEGLELVKRSLLTRFAQFGVTHVPAHGEPFDPMRHEAIAMVPVGDPAKDGRVIDVMREGYAIGEDTLRPAQVAVGKHA